MPSPRDGPERDPSGDLRGALPQPGEKHFAAITEPAEVAKLLKVTEGHPGGIIVKAALRLAPLVFLRPGELRKGEWKEIDFETGLWTIPAKKMKLRRDHIIPLSRQALGILAELKEFTGFCLFFIPRESIF